MNWYRNNWYNLTIVWFILLTFYLLFGGVSTFSPIQHILLGSFMALLVHQFEEYVLPGGGPVVVNKATFHERVSYRNFPGNMHSSMIVNHLAYLVYITALLNSDWIWLGLATMFFNLFQLFGHGYQMNKALHTWYNPGLASVVFLFVPIAIYYMVFISNAGLAEGIDWLLGGLSFVALVVCTTIIPVQLLKDKKSPYAMSEWQMQQQERVEQWAKLK